MTKTVLIVEDDRETREEIAETLSEEGYLVLPAGNAAEMWSQLETQPADLILLDLMLPDGNGLELARNIRQRSKVGIIIVSGKTAEVDRVVGLEVGADDYITKPYSPRELIARVRSVLRRLGQDSAVESSAKTTIFSFEDWRLDITARTLTSPGDESVELSSGEFNLLKAFVEHPNRVLSRDQLLDYTHANDTPAFDRSVDVRVGRVRKKIEADPKKPEIITTVVGCGYKFSARID